MTNSLGPNCLTILRRLSNLPEHAQPKKQYTKLHPAHNTQTTTMTQTYNHINIQITQGLPITITTLRKDLPHLPPQILQELIKCTHKVRGYHPATGTLNTYHPPPDTINIDNHQHTTLQIITWNTGCISFSLPGIQELTHTLHQDPHIILI